MGAFALRSKHDLHFKRVSSPQISGARSRRSALTADLPRLQTEQTVAAAVLGTFNLFILRIWLRRGALWFWMDRAKRWCRLAFDGLFTSEDKVCLTDYPAESQSFLPTTYFLAWATSFFPPQARTRLGPLSLILAFELACPIATYWFCAVTPPMPVFSVFFAPSLSAEFDLNG